MGDSTREQLLKVGYTDEEIDKLRAKKIVSKATSTSPSVSTSRSPAPRTIWSPR